MLAVLSSPERRRSYDMQRLECWDMQVSCLGVVNINSISFDSCACLSICHATFMCLTVLELTMIVVPAPFTLAELLVLPSSHMVMQGYLTVLP